MRVLPAVVLIVWSGLAAARTTLPVPPMPPRRPPADQAAPVPNVDAQGPLPAPIQAPRVNVELYRLRDYDASQGFAPGSKYQSAEERKPIQTPGFRVTVPFR